MNRALTHTHTHTHAHAHTYMHTHMHTHMYTHMHAFTHMHACMHAHTHTHIYIHTYTTYNHICTHPYETDVTASIQTKHYPWYQDLELASAPFFCTYLVSRIFLFTHTHIHTHKRTRTRQTTLQFLVQGRTLLTR